MALPSSGTLGMNSIRTELGIPSQAPFSLDTAENGGYVALNNCSPYKPNPSNPAAISEWYGYNHTAACYNSGSNFTYSSTTCCTGSGGPTYTIYSCCSPLALNCFVWSNSGCSSALSDGYWTDWTNNVCYYTSGGQIKTINNCTTTTTTTAPPTITITVYIKYGGAVTGETLSNYGFYYALSSDGGATYGSDILIVGGSSISTTCSSWTITVPQNNYGAFGFRTTAGGKGSGRYFTGTKIGGTCPTQAQNYCGTAGNNPYITNWSTSNLTLYFTIFVDIKSDPSTFVQC